MFRGHLKGFLILALITGIIVTSATITQATPPQHYAAQGSLHPANSQKRLSYECPW